MNKTFWIIGFAAFVIGCGDKTSDVDAGSELIAFTASGKCWEAAQKFQTAIPDLCKAKGIKTQCLSAIGALKSDQKRFMEQTGCVQIEEFMQNICSPKNIQARIEVLSQTQRNATEDKMPEILFQGVCSRNANEGSSLGISSSFTCWQWAKKFKNRLQTVEQEVCKLSSPEEGVAGLCEEVIPSFTLHNALATVMTVACDSTMKPLSRYVCAAGLHDNASDRFATYFQGICSRIANR
ncbi:MAG: hypothetical protein AAF320_06565 [Myxococcota bacterium]